MAESQLIPPPAPKKRKYPSGSRKRKLRAAGGGPQYSPSDIAQYKERANKAYAAKAEYVNAIKSARGCADCGYNAHPAALHFDHLPGRGKYRNVSQLCVHHKMERLAEEIAKCEVVCANCHAIRTWERKQHSQPLAPACRTDADPATDASGVSTDAKASPR